MGREKNGIPALKLCPVCHLQVKNCFSSLPSFLHCIISIFLFVPCLFYWFVHLTCLLPCFTCRLSLPHFNKLTYSVYKYKGALFLRQDMNILHPVNPQNVEIIIRMQSSSESANFQMQDLIKVSGFFLHKEHCYLG